MDTCTSSKYAEGGNSSSELNEDTTSTSEQTAGYKSAMEEFSTENATVSVTIEQPYEGSVAEHLEHLEELQLEDPASSLREQSCYGTAPEHLWSVLLQPEDPSCRVETVNEEERFEYFTQIDPTDLKIGEEIAQDGQARVFLATCNRQVGDCVQQQNVVVKRYKHPGTVDVVQLQRRMEKTMELRRKFGYGLCGLIGFSKDNTTGEVSVVMKAYRGDLRNLIDLRLRYLKSRIRNMKKKNDAQMMMMMPFDYHHTLLMMLQIALGVQRLHVSEVIHKDLKASNIFVSPAHLNSRQGGYEIVQSRNVKLKQDWAYDFFVVGVGDFESSDGVVGTGFWRAREVLKALKENRTPKYTPAVDVYGFGMVFYELLTGRIPFEGHGLSNYDLVLSGRTPELPDYVSPEITYLLHKCWHIDPCQRPGWIEIMYISGAEAKSTNNYRAISVLNSKDDEFMVT